MTSSCKTGCDAEINYKSVWVSNPLDWYDIPMEGDVIHDCPKLKPAPNDRVERQQNWGSGASFTRLKELQGLHATLHDGILIDMVYDYGSQISDFGDLPHDLKMHSKGKLAQRMISNPTEGDIFVPENYDKLSAYQKEEFRSFYGFENPNKTPKERIAEFWDDITQAMSFLQRCMDICPAPFYVDEYGYSQLELFRILLESKEQYDGAMICHTIQGAIDTAKSQMDVDAHIEVTDRLQKKLDEQRLAKADEGEKTLRQWKSEMISRGMDEKQIQQEVEIEDQLHVERESSEFAQHDSSMKWALELYAKELEKRREESRQDDSLEHHEEQIEVDDTVHKEQSVEDEIFEQLDAEETRTTIYNFEKDFLRPAVRKQFSSEKEMNEKLKNMKWGAGRRIVGNLFEKAQFHRKKEESEELQAEDRWSVGLLRFLDFGDDVNIGEWPLYIHNSLKEIQTHRNRLMAHPNDYRKVELQHAQKIVSLNIERCKRFFESLKLK